MATIYVSKTGNDGNSGLTWALAKLTVAAGIAASVSGDEIWVALGTYVERITLKLGVGLYGGFAGTETLRSQRDWVTNVTVLDGDAGGSVVISPTGATAATVIDGFTVQHGNATDGGGILCVSSSPTITDNTITGNTASRFGGGICYTADSSPTITNNIIAGNTALYGAGICRRAGICSGNASPGDESCPGVSAWWLDFTGITGADCTVAKMAPHFPDWPLVKVCYSGHVHGSTSGCAWTWTNYLDYLSMRDPYSSTYACLQIRTRTSDGAIIEIISTHLTHAYTVLWGQEYWTGDPVCTLIAVTCASGGSLPQDHGSCALSNLPIYPV